MSDKKRIKELEKTIVALDTAFHDTGDDCVDPFTGEIILDNEYDALKRELLTLCPESKIFTTVTASKSKMKGEKIIHDPPMTSINKCNGSEEEKQDILNKFFEDCKKTIKYAKETGKNLDQFLADNFSMSYKIDGIAASLIYKNGNLKSCGLRSKSGQDGISVTDKTQYIQGIPQKLPLPISCTIRGEIYINIDTFNKINSSLLEKEKFSNARALTAGSMNRKTNSKMKKGMRFTAYNILNFEDDKYKTEIARASWAAKSLGLDFVKTIPFSFEMLEIFENQHRRLNHMTDGVVISINDLELQKEMGHNGSKDTGNLKSKIAWKFKDQIKTTIVREILWSCGRQGAITPVLIINPVQLEGTQVQRVTAHNVGIIKSKKIGIGSEIEIIKSGKIIPKIHKVVKAQGSANIPTTCPSCKGHIEEVEGQNEALSLVCDNSDCPAQNIKNLNHWFKILGVKGIAEKNIEKLINVGLISTPGDFYRLTIPNLEIAGFTKRTAVLIVARIWMINSPENIKDNDLLTKSIEGHSSEKIKIPMEKFLAAFGINTSGKEAGRILEKEIGDWQKIKTATVDMLEVFDGIGPTMAQEIVSFFQKNKEMVSDVEQYFEFETKVSGGKLEGKSFCLSGSMEMGKEYWKEQIEAQGGICKSSVSKKLDYLVAGDGSGNKSIKAESYGIPILDEEALEKMLNS